MSSYRAVQDENPFGEGVALERVDLWLASSENLNGRVQAWVSSSA